MTLWFKAGLAKEVSKVVSWKGTIQCVWVYNIGPSNSKLLPGYVEWDL